MCDAPYTAPSLLSFGRHTKMTPSHVDEFVANSSLHGSIVTIANISVVTSRGRVIVNIAPNAFPAIRYVAKRDTGDESPIEYIQVSFLTYLTMLFLFIIW